MTDYTTISIPRELKEDVDEFIEDTNFTSAAEFTKHLLRDTIAGGDLDAGPKLNKDEVQKVRDRLRNLGYLE